MIRRIRLISGLILFSYVTLHLTSQVLGIASLGLMEWSRPILHGIWDTRVGQTLLYGAATTHLALAFYALYARRQWRGMRYGEIVQIVVGFSIPPLLVLHLLSTRVAAELYDLDPNYPWILAIYFKYDMASGLRQVAVLICAWVHGCLGIYFWLSLKPWWHRARFPLFGAALLWPVLALAGFYNAGRDAAELTENTAWVRLILSEVGNLDPEQMAFLKTVETWVFAAVGGLLVLIFAGREIRRLVERRAGVVCIRYDDGRQIDINHGLSILDASRHNGIPHASVCNGKGRCSTCRVRIRSGEELLPPPSEAELRVLQRIRAPDDVRLACQCVPNCGTIDITPLLPPDATARDGFQRPEYLQGREVEIAVLFADMRGFTQLSEQRLPYDTVFILNRYFDMMGRAIADAGGHLDKFIGDGVMALFGVGGDPALGCRQALQAAHLMSERLAALNEGLKNDLDQPLRIGIGIHAGPAIVGEMGYGRATQLTAVGDTVNTASRLETMTKEYGVELVVSNAVFRIANLPVQDGLPEHQVTVRGRSEPMTVFAISVPRDLAVDSVGARDRAPEPSPIADG